ncbi:MAG TPA: hypothetical protein VGZ33_06295 [Acidimicrobiales bacterium]|jgi:hypothetical protein|nr:hypothetical protein [Acidimicrobiales bacterium]
MRLGVGSSTAAVLLCAALLAGCGTRPATTLPHGAVETLTGYSKTSPVNETGVATSTRLTAAKGAALRRAIESLEVVPRAQCWENQLLFKLVVDPPADGHGSVWTATALLCPVPGQIQVGAITYRATCSVIRLAASYLPEGRSGACISTRT